MGRAIAGAVRWLATQVKDAARWLLAIAAVLDGAGQDRRDRSGRRCETGRSGAMIKAGLVTPPNHPQPRRGRVTVGASL